VSEIDAAIRAALRIHEQRRRELREALESRDPEAVVRWARRELGIEEGDGDEARDRAGARLQRGASRT
jgi:hypothetical protein